MTSTLITVFNLTTIVWQASFVVYKLTESETRNQHFTVSYVTEHLCGCTLMWQQIQVFYICNISKTKQTAQAQIQGRWDGWIFTPLFLSPFLSFFFLSLKYWNNIWFLWFLWLRWRNFTPHFKILDPRLHRHALSTRTSIFNPMYYRWRLLWSIFEHVICLKDLSNQIPFLDQTIFSSEKENCIHFFQN